MKFIGIILCGLLFHSSSLSQVISIVDSMGQPVPYATVEICKKKTAFFSSAGGIIDIGFLGIADNDTLIISSIGYKTLHVTRNRISGKIVLASQVKQLPGVIVYSGQWKKENWGCDGKVERNSIYNFHLLKGPGEQIGRIIYPKKNLNDAFIEKISFLYTNAGITYAPVRLRVYELNDQMMPEGDLLTETITRSLSAERGWLEFDLKGNTIKIPAKGVFIAAEFFSTDSAFWHKDQNFWIKDSTGVLRNYTENILGGAFRIDDYAKECETYKRENGEWIRLETKWLIKPYYCYNLVVKVWVKYPKR